MPGSAGAPAERAAAAGFPAHGRQRVVVCGVTPDVDCGRYPVKRVVGEEVEVEADLVADGHDALAAVVRWRTEGAEDWHESPMRPVGNDRWRGVFALSALGRHAYAVQAWVDPFLTWQRDLAKRVAARQDVEVDLLLGAQIVERVAGSAGDEDARAELGRLARALAAADEPSRERSELALDPASAALVSRHAPRTDATQTPERWVVVDPLRARFSSWYELFPRSAASGPGAHGTFRDVQRRLEYVAALGFDVLYLPPIHPIGSTFRKGPNNAPEAAPGDVGSPWAIGSAAGGHAAAHGDLGTLEDFRELVRAARARGIEVALDVAFQTSPDHPWVREHPEWFRSRPDGTIQYAENPPKKYQDIYPFDFESRDWQGLWEALAGIFEFWIEQGVTVFRVDNPHTKSLPFWEWCIERLKRLCPELVLLSEAFTRPKLMAHLAKVGFTQSYTYFPWRNGKAEIIEYLTELTRSPLREYLRPNHWPNTPDILTEYLQTGGRAAFAVRLVLAATLGASYGVYGPAFELLESRPLREGSEEYLDSEKYQIRHWDLEDERSLAGLIERVNRIRRENPALQSDWSLHFHPTDNDQVVCYSKRAGENAVLIVVNLDPHHTHAAWLHLDLHDLGLEQDGSFQAHDLISGARYLWQGSSNFVQLDPQVLPAHAFRIRRKLRTERDFDYYL